MNNEKEAIKRFLDAIKDKKSAKAYENDPSLPRRIIEKDKKEIEKMVVFLENYHSELLPYVKNLKRFVNDITDNTRECAVYLILGRIFKNWEALFLLARAGMDIPMMNVLRLIKESGSLVDCISFDENYQQYIDRWFKGKKVMPWEIRKSVSDSVNNHLTKNFNFRKMKGDIYNVESHYAHPSYISMLESVNIFTKDFDFIGSSAYHFTNENLKYIHGSMDSTATSLKSVYTTILKDSKGHDELDKIYKKNCDKTNFPQEMADALKKYEL